MQNGRDPCLIPFLASRPTLLGFSVIKHFLHRLLIS